jgi:hypothetical protein
MAPMCQQYVERCEKLGREADEALLGPIAAVRVEPGGDRVWIERLSAGTGW